MESGKERGMGDEKELGSVKGFSGFNASSSVE